MPQGAANLWGVVILQRKENSSKPTHPQRLVSPGSVNNKPPVHKANAAKGKITLQLLIRKYIFLSHCSFKHVIQLSQLRENVHERQSVIPLQARCGPERVGRGIALLFHDRGTRRG